TSSLQRKKDRNKTWMADIEPLSILINVVGGSFGGLLIDRRLQCTVELPLESELHSAKTSALVYAEQYMHLHLKDAFWVLPPRVAWSEFVTIRSSEDLQQRITAQRPAIASSRVVRGLSNQQSSNQSGPSRTQPFLVKCSASSPAPLFLGVSAGRYVG